MTLPVGWMCCETGDEDISVLIVNKGKAQPGELWAVSGCVRGVGGDDQHEQWTEYLSQKFNLKPMVVPCNERFQLGDGHVERSSK